MNFYWELEQFDGTVIDIPPEAVDTVKRRWDSGQPIHTTNMTIPANQIKSFRQTAKPYGVPLLEAAAQAFNDPILLDEAIAVRWVKKPVPGREYNKLYSGVPAYRKLDTLNGLTVVAFRMPIHLIDHNKVSECSEDEVLSLTSS